MINRKYRARSAIASLLLCLIVNAAAADSSQPARAYNPQDPYEKFNRAMFRFNDLVDKIILKPVAKLYNKIVPAPIVKGISHMFSNIDTIPTIANDILQFNFYQATSDTWRLALNSTVGIAGFFDVATEMGLEYNYEDLGLTFARWGWKNSNYLVVPMLGPSTVRDGIAWPIDYELFTIYPWIRDVRDRYIVYGVSVVSKRAELLRFQSVMEQAAIDRYAFLRDAYTQRRAYLIDRNERLGDPYIEKNNSEIEKSSDDQTIDLTADRTSERSADDQTITPNATTTPNPNDTAYTPAP
jgi:phospholipid-binding lipoprotein MlaA